MSKFELINNKIEKSKEGDVYDREKIMRSNDGSGLN